MSLTTEQLRSLFNDTSEDQVAITLQLASENNNDMDAMLKIVSPFINELIAEDADEDMTEADIEGMRAAIEAVFRTITSKTLEFNKAGKTNKEIVDQFKEIQDEFDSAAMSAGIPALIEEKILDAGVEINTALAQELIEISKNTDLTDEEMTKQIDMLIGKNMSQ